ncbi:uncharacterized protein RCH25_018276 [Pelodytes ibericus]
MTSHRTRVAVIGAGAAGLCCARHLLSRPFIYEPPVVFELSGKVGGTWVYAEGSEGESHSSMYRDLRTNLPKEVMEFPDFGFDPSLPSFIHHTEVLRYLEGYTDKFGVRRHIRFGCRVMSVSPVPGGCDSGLVPWDVTSHMRGETRPVTERFDAVMVCVGHYSHPYIPDIAGIDIFRGDVLHSHAYRCPEVFSSRSVVILGSGPSGVDMVLELAPYARQVTLSHRGPVLQWNPPENVKVAPPVVGATAETLVCEDGTSLEADTLIFCTGYKYHYPFLVPEKQPRIPEDIEDSISEVSAGPNGESEKNGMELGTSDKLPEHEDVLKIHGKMSTGILDYDALTVTDMGQGHLPPLYKHLIHARYPTLCFIGACKIVIPFPLFHCQVLFFLAVLEGKYQLPSRWQMLAESCQELQNHVNSGTSLKYLHRLGVAQWEYNNWLAEAAGFEPLPSVLAKMYEICQRTRNSDLISFRDFKFEVLSSEDCRAILHKET